MRIVLVAGGFDYERPDVEDALRDISGGLSALGWDVVVLDPRVPGSESALADALPAVCLIVDPFAPSATDGSKFTDFRETLDRMAVPYVGCSRAAAVVRKDKILSKEYARSVGVGTARHVSVPHDASPEWLDVVATLFGYPLVLKPLDQGAGFGVIVVHDRKSLIDQYGKSRSAFRNLMIEEFAPGVDVTVPVIGAGSNIRTLPPVELILRGSIVYDYDTKRNSPSVDRFCPARLPRPMLDHLRHAAAAVHRRIGCSGITRSDFRVHENIATFIEINSSPALCAKEHVPRSAAAIGLSFPQLLSIIIHLS